ncbi:HYR domain-containing protein, partial [archaeon]|nr:HYR domain-containing protein [archaeon]
KDNAIVVGPASWTSGVPITYSVDGLPVGTYTYLIEVSNTNGKTAPDPVIVTVTNPIAPVVAITGLPATCTNQNQAASVSCTPTNGVACNSNSYKMKFSTANPGTCSTNYNDYTSTTPYTAAAYGWLCAAAKNVAGVAGFSALYEVKIDKTPPVVSAGTCIPLNPKTTGYISITDPVSITAPASDDWCGIKEIKIFDNGVEIVKQLPAPFPYGTHTITATATDNAGNPATGNVCAFIVNDQPAISITKKPTECNAGETIAIECTASDLNQQASALSTKAWLGTCTAGDCFDTRLPWNIYTERPMTWNGQAFTTSYTIPYGTQIGTGIAFTCQATDEKGALSDYADAYPLCIVGGCVAPTFSNIVANPNPSWNQVITITFTSSDVLTGNPAVTVKETGRSASFVSKINNDYVYSYTVLPTDAEGTYNIEISGIKGTGCSGTVYGKLEVRKPIDTINPVVSVSHSPANPTTSQQVTFTATATDASGIKEVKFYTDGVLRSTDTTPPYSYTGGPYSTGTYTYYATATDDSQNGNIGTSPVNSFTVSTVPPIVPTINSPADITYEVGATGNSISWIPNSNGGTPDKYTIKKDNAIVVGPASWTSGVPITYSVDGLPV